MAAIVGIDFSTRAVDFVVLDETTGEARHARRGLHGRDALERTRTIRDVMPARGWWLDHVCAVAIEEPFARGQGGGYTLQLALGAILACLPARLELRLIRADDWRRECGLPMRGERADLKAAAVTYARGHAPFPILDDNMADAYCIALAAWRILDREAQSAA